MKKDQDILAKALNVSLKESRNIAGFSIDTRTIKSEEVFVAIKGENFDGNDFALEALNKGASYVIMDSKEKAIDSDFVVIVDNAQQALEKIALYIRKVSEAKFIAVTGSVGKTSIKSMLNAALQLQDNTYASVGNFNNHIGLPLCMANLPLDAKYAIFELGMNHSGEISQLSKIVKPDVSVISTVEPAHLEFFKSVSAIAEAKSEIFDGMKEGGYAVLNIDNPYYEIMKAKALAKKLQIVSFGESKNADFRLLDSKTIENYKTEVVLEHNNQIIKYELNTIGKHNAINSVAVLAAIKCAGAEIDNAARFGLKGFLPPKGRGVKIELSNQIILLDETYNASPASAKSSIQYLSEFNGRKILVMGDMKELGSKSEILHRELASVIIENSIDKVFTVGGLAKYLFDSLPQDIRVAHCDNSDETSVILSNYIKNGDVILIKGSRSMRMENIVNVLIKNYSL